MDQKEQEHEWRRRKLPTEPRMEQVTYWRQKPDRKSVPMKTSNRRLKRP